MITSKTTRAVAAAAAATCLAGTSALTAPAANADTIAFQNARDTLYAAAYKTEQAAKVGYHTTSVQSVLLNNGTVQPQQRVRAWVANMYSGEVGATVREDIYRNGKYTPYTAYGSANLNPATINVLTGWTALHDGLYGKQDRRVLRKLPQGAKYAVGPTPGVADSKYLPDGVTYTLTLSGDVPWAVDEYLWMCDEEGFFDEVQCTGNVTGEGKAKTWTFTVTQTSYNGKVYTYNITAASNTDGLITSQTVESTNTVSPVVYRTAVQGEYFQGNEVGVLPTPKLTGKHVVKSRALTDTAARTSVTALARHLKAVIEAELAGAGKRLSTKNVEWVVRQLDREGVSSWWDTPRASNSWVRSTGFGNPNNGTFVLYAYGNDELTAVEMAATVSVNAGKWRTEIGPTPLR